MDTRTKILPIENLPAALHTGDWIVAAGLFDPLTITQARRLSAFATDHRKLLAIVLDGHNPLLSTEARALLVASLRDVSVVSVAHSDAWRNFIPRTSRVYLHEDQDGEQARTAEFVDFVLKRQNG